MAVFVGCFLLLAAVCGWIWNRRRWEKSKREWEREKQEREEKDKAAARAWNRVLSAGIFSLLGIRGAEELEPGLYRAEEGTVLAIKFPSESKSFVQKDGRRQMELLSQMYQTIYPVLEKTGYAGESGDSLWMNIIYKTAPIQAVKAGIAICARLQEMEEREFYRGFSMGIAFGETPAGTFGTSVKVKETLVFKTGRISRFLAEKAPKYGTKLLVAQDTAEQIPNFFRRFRVRCLGYFHHESLDVMVKVYDVYDGDEFLVRQKKERTSLLFEQGVELYGRRDWGEARRAFAEVLRVSREDRAARIYLEQCDRYARRAAGGRTADETPVWIEGGR